jgi:GNAT superfamily N-acetyltransferase
MEIVDVEPGDARLGDEVFPVLQELRPHLTAADFGDVYREGHAQGLRYTAVYDGGRCVAVAGWRLVADTATRRKLYIDDLVTTAERRGGGAGRVLVAELRQRAEAAGCTQLDLDSAVHRADAHRFYMREGLTIVAFHFGVGLTTT